MCSEYRETQMSHTALRRWHRTILYVPLPDFANGFFLEILEFWDGGESIALFKFGQLMQYFISG
jgi:hypothetical protein